MNAAKFFSKMMLLCAIIVFSLAGNAIAGESARPTISLGTQLAEGARRGASNVVITPGVADLGQVTNHQLKKGLSWEAWGIDSKIKNHSIAIQDIYHIGLLSKIEL
jgi:hypothetical protein